MGVLQAALALLLSFLLSPVTILVLGLVVVLAVLAIVVKNALAVKIWMALVGGFDQALADMKNNAHAYVIVFLAFLFFPQYAIIAALAYVVVKAYVKP